MPPSCFTKPQACFMVLLPSNIESIPPVYAGNKFRPPKCSAAGQAGRDKWKRGNC